MKVGLLQNNPTIGDFPANVPKILDGYQQAAGQGAEWVVAPELAICGYPPRDLLLRRDFVQRNESALAELSAGVGDVPLVVGLVGANPVRPGKPLSNAAAVLHQGREVFRTSKCLLPTYDVFDESRYFEPAHEVQVCALQGKRLGITICEDIWNDEDFWPERMYQRDPVAELVRQGAEMIINLSASPWHRGKQAVRLSMLQRVARDERVPLLQVNMVGGNDELIFDGHSLALDANGRVIALGRGFAEEVLVVDMASPGDRDQIEWAPAPSDYFAALVLGTRDYLQKCGFRSAVIGLSGGIDSAVTAAVAAEALGKDQVMGLAMPSRFSSQGSLQDAEGLARNLGIRFEKVAIEPAVVAAEQLLAPLFAGLPRNEAEENVQSRLRGLTLMAMSNKFGSLVLTTGNKSELAVGYCTLYGDMCGALAVIADLFKTEVYELARWLNREREVVPDSTITKPPSAELRPDQKDEDSLPPYEILDAILDRYVVREQSRDEIIRDGFDPAVVNDIINKVTFSEYKRRQAAPGLKVSPRAFGTGRRIPIAQRFRTSVREP